MTFSGAVLLGMLRVKVYVFTPASMDATILNIKLDIYNFTEMTTVIVLTRLCCLY